MKRILSSLLVFFMAIYACSSLTVPALAAERTVTINGTDVKQVRVVSGVTYVPLRSAAKLLDSSLRITWDSSSKRMTLKTSGLSINAKVGNCYLSANGRYFFTGSSARIRRDNGKVYVPVNTLAKAFHTKAKWNDSKTVCKLTSANKPVERGSNHYDDRSVYWLSRIISAEARGESMRGKIAVGSVILNRVRSNLYPNTIYGVIFERSAGIQQFTPVSNGTIYKTPTKASIIAAKIVLDGGTVSSKALYFMNPRISTSSWISRNRPYLFTIGDHKFYR